MDTRLLQGPYYCEDKVEEQILFALGRIYI